MKVRSEDEWQKQLAEFAQDNDPMSDVLPKFLVFWCERAERFLDEESDYVGQTEKPPWLTPIGALRAALRATEDDLGRIQIGYLGMALVLACTHWEPAGDPDEFFQSMTDIEQNLFGDVAAVKIYLMQEQAQEQEEGEPSE